AGKLQEGSREIRKPETSASSPSPRTRSPVNAKRRSRRDATSSTPSRSNLIGCSQPFGAFSPATNDALCSLCPAETSRYVRNFKGMDHRSLAVGSPANQNKLNLSQRSSLMVWRIGE